MSPVDPENPWLQVSAADYEAHMGPGGADQLAALSGIFGEVYARLRPRRIAVLGCATGNGFEHIKPEWTRRVFAVDINSRYLDILRRRHEALEPILELVNTPAETFSPGRESLDLVSAGLVFEYLDPVRLLDRISCWLAPGGRLSVVLQRPSSKQGVVSETRCDGVKILESVIRLVPSAEFEAGARVARLKRLEGGARELKDGKSFYVGLFARA